MKRSSMGLVLLILGAWCSAPSPSLASVSAVAIARDGMPAPGGNGAFGGYSNYGEPFVNDSGQVVFSCRLVATTAGSADDEAIVRGVRDGAPMFIAREGQSIPDGPGLFGALHFVTRQYAINDSGRVVFVAPLTGTAGGTADNQALYSAVTPGLYWLHARRGQSVPGTALPLGSIFPPQINDQPPAAVAFHATLGTNSNPGVVYTSRLGVFSPVSWFGQATPDAGSGSGFNGTLFSYPYAGSDPPALRRNANEVALYAHSTGTAQASLDDDGIYRASPDGFVDFARGMRGAPGGGNYQEFWSSPVYNANGIAAFGAYLNPVPSGGEIIALDWPFGGDLVAYKGQSAADGNGTLASFYAPSLNNHEAVAYRVLLSGTAGGGLDDEAIMKGDSALLVVPPLEDQIARENQTVPGGNGRFASFGSVTAINDAGQVLFVAALRGTSGGASDDRALYLWDPVEGLVSMLREGDVIDGRHVIAFSTLTQSDFGGDRALSETGEAVARVRFAELGGDGIYLFRFTRPAAVGPVTQRPGPRLALFAGPNPVKDGPLAVRWEAPGAEASARITVLDIGGRAIRTLALDPGRPGRASWDLADAHGRAVPAGIYVVMLETPLGARARRIACVR